MAISKIIYKSDENDSGTTWMDVTDDNPTSGTMFTGVQATGANGQKVQGSYTAPSPSDSTPQMDGTGAAGSSTDYSRADHVHPTDTSRASTSHASSSTTYGTGTSSNYGHLKLSDSTSSTSGTSGGIAATPSAVKSAYDLASGKYSKPSGGIPSTDLASAVQTSLGKADTALQSFTESDPVFTASAAYGISSSDITAWNGKGTYSKPSGGIPSTDLASAVQTSLGKADTALQSFTETDPTVPSWAKASSKPSYTASEVGAIAAPSSPTSGDVLTYNGSAWAASAPKKLAAYSGTLTTTWTTDSNGYKVQTVSGGTLAGLKASYDVPPIVDVSLSGTDTSADESLLEAWALVSLVQTGTDSITALCTGDNPTVQIPITIMVWE